MELFGRKRGSWDGSLFGILWKLGTFLGSGLLAFFGARSLRWVLGYDGIWTRETCEILGTCLCVIALEVERLAYISMRLVYRIAVLGQRGIDGYIDQCM